MTGVSVRSTASRAIFRSACSRRAAANWTSTSWALRWSSLSLLVSCSTRFLRRRDEHQDPIAFVASVGDFDLLLLRAVWSMVSSSWRTATAAFFGLFDVHRCGGRRRMVRPACMAFFGPGADDHHEDNQNADEVGDDVEERVLPGSVDFMAHASCHLSLLRTSRPLPSSSTRSSSKRCSAPGVTWTLSTGFQ